MPIDPLVRFERIAREKNPAETQAVLIVDSPWLPGLAGVNTLDFFFDRAVWLETYRKAHAALPSVALLPDGWLEFGMATEPSVWGVPVQWNQNFPPSVRHFPGTLEQLAAAPVPDPEQAGLMPALLRQWECLRPAMTSAGMPPRMAAARGPLAIASHLLGVPELLMATHLERSTCLAFLEKVTELIVRWLEAQIKRMDQPMGILVLDDIVGMVGPADARVIAFPFLKRIFDAFPDLVHVFHNDTPNAKIYPGLAELPIDVFNFSNEIDIPTARKLVGPDMVLMGNIPPLDVLTRGTPEQVRASAEEVCSHIAQCGPIMVSPGGGVSPGTPLENLLAMVEVVDRFTGDRGV